MLAFFTKLPAIGHGVRLISPSYLKPFVKRGKTDAADAEAICKAVRQCASRIFLIVLRDVMQRTMKTFASAICPAPSRRLVSYSNPRMVLMFGEGAMTFSIHAWKDGQSNETVRIRLAVAVDKARVLQSAGWQVHVTDSAGRQFDPSDFELNQPCLPFLAD